MDAVARYAYLHCKPDGIPFYVGKGALRRVKNMRERNPWHKHIVAKYGAKNILVGKLECSTEKTAFDLERGLIKCLRRSGVSLCNFTDGGEGGSNPVPETRARVSAAAKKRGVGQAAREASRNAKTGVPLSTEQKKKQSDAMRVSWAKRVITDEHRQHLRDAAKKRGVSKAANIASVVARKGKKFPHSEATKEKMRAAAKERVALLPPKQKLALAVRVPKPVRIKEIKKRNPARYWLGKTRSAETIKKISDTKKRRGTPYPTAKSMAALPAAVKKSAELRRKRLKCLDDGRVFSCAKEEASYYGLKTLSVSAAASGKRKWIHKFRFAYIGDKN